MEVVLEVERVCGGGGCRLQLNLVVDDDDACELWLLMVLGIYGCDLW